MLRPTQFGCLAALMVLAALITIPGGSSAESNDPQPWGTFVWHTQFGSGSVPALVTFHQDGTVMVSDGFMFGGLPGATTRMTPLNGVWERTGAKSIGGTSLWLIFDAATGVLTGFGRARSALEFPEDFDHLQGIMVLERLPCPSPVICPDPLDPNAAWVPYLPPHPQAFEVTAARLHRVSVEP